jgi:hypothetical protein
MAYTGTNSIKRTIYPSGSQESLRQQKPLYTQQQQIYSQQQPIYSQQQPTYSVAQERHIYEEQPYYSNEQTISRQSVGGDIHRSDGVCDVLFFILKERRIVT